MNALLEKQAVEEAVLLAETIAAVESSKDPNAAQDVSPQYVQYVSTYNQRSHGHSQGIVVPIPSLLFCFDVGLGWSQWL